MNKINDYSLLLFEDDLFRKFHPLTLTRPVDDLRIGIFTIREKWERIFKPSATTRNLRQNLEGVFTNPKIDSDKPCLVINARLLPTDDILDMIKSLEPDQALFSNGTLLAGIVSGKTANQWLDQFPEKPEEAFKRKEVGNPLMLDSVWKLFRQNGDQIIRDISLIDPESVASSNNSFPDVSFVKPENIYIGEEVTIEPGVVIIAREGPVYIGDGARIMAGSYLRGPAAICERATVKMGAKIYEETTIGPVCKVGGEISNVIFHSFSNKAHDGYAGNSVFGQWCNLGADTNTSNLKNNYSTVRVRDWESNKMLETGQQFIGTIMGDHSKTGINAMLNTGTLCGVCCNLFSDDYPPKFVPSFSWVSGHDIVPFHFEKAIEAMERMMARRSVELTPSYKKMMEAIFRSTSF